MTHRTRIRHCTPWTMLLAAGAVSCAQKPNAPVPQPPMPPGIVAVHPAPRSAGVPYETEIWFETSGLLDPSSVDERNVFLKVDAARIPIDVSWVPSTHRVVIVPRERLALRRTHTVELTSRVTGADGAPLRPYFWQFTTSSVRRLTAPMPGHGASNISPFSPLAWDSTERAAGDIRYSVYHGPDSSSVAARVMSPSIVTPRPVMLPASRWGTGTQVWWAVDVVNLSTGESQDGPTWRFSTVPTGTPVDSLEVPALQWGQAGLLGGTVFRSCFGTTIVASSNYTSAVDWDISRAGSGRVLADAVLRMTTTGGNPSSQAFTISGAVDLWAACAVDLPGPPFRDQFLGALAEGEALSFNRVRFRSDRFTAHLQARIEGYKTPGYILASSGTMVFGSPTATAGAPPVLMLMYYVLEASEP